MLEMGCYRAQRSWLVIRSTESEGMGSASGMFVPVSITR